MEGDLHAVRLTLLINQGRFEASIAAGRRALEIAREIGDERRLIDALLALTLCLSTMGLDEEMSVFAAELAPLAQSFGDELRISRANVMQAMLKSVDPQRGREFFSTSIATQKRLRRQRMAGLSLMHWAIIELERGDPPSATEIALQAVGLCRSIEPTMHARPLGLLRLAFLRAGDPARARTAALEQLELAARLQTPLDCRNAVTAVVALQERVADPPLAARLLGYADHASPRSFRATVKMIADVRARAAARITAEIGAAAFAANALEGSTWDEEAAYSEALKL